MFRAKIILSVLLISVLSALFSGCGRSGADTDGTPDITGRWKYSYTIMTADDNTGRKAGEKFSYEPFMINKKPTVYEFKADGSFSETEGDGYKSEGSYEWDGTYFVVGKGGSKMKIEFIDKKTIKMVGINIDNYFVRK